MRVQLSVSLILIGSFAAAAESVPPPLTFHLTPQGGIVVPVIVNGFGPCPFIVDTGSSGSAISQELADRLNAPIVAKTSVASAIGQKPRLVARIEQLAMGEVAARELLVTITPSAEFDVPDTAEGGRKVQGIIGQDVLAGLRYTIDYRRRQIVWRDEADKLPLGASVLELEPHDDRFLVVLPQRRETLRLVPDSGSEALVLFRRERRIDPPMLLDGPRTELASLAGKASAAFARVSSLRIGATTLIDVPAVVVDREGGAAGDGLLPLHMFARVTFNGPERQLLIEQ